jgi:hypothetical protein
MEAIKFIDKGSYMDIYEILIYINITKQRLNA